MPEELEEAFLMLPLEATSELLEHAIQRRSIELLSIEDLRRLQKTLQATTKFTSEGTFASHHAGEE